APSSRRLRVPRNYQNAMLPQKGIQPSVNRNSPRGAGRCFRSLLYFGNNRHRQKPFGGLKPDQDGGSGAGFQSSLRTLASRKKGVICAAANLQDQWSATPPARLSGRSWAAARIGRSPALGLST